MIMNEWFKIIQNHWKPAVSRLLKKFGTYLRAWKICLDRDGDNRCTWDEFRDACKDIGWSEDVPGERFRSISKRFAGAWSAFDHRRSGPAIGAYDKPNKLYTIRRTYGRIHRLI